MYMTRIISRVVGKSKTLKEWKVVVTNIIFDDTKKSYEVQWSNGKLNNLKKGKIELKLELNMNYSEIGIN